MAQPTQPNVVYFQVDNLGYGEPHSWTLAHFGRLQVEFAASVRREPPIPAGALLDFVPTAP